MSIFQDNTLGVDNPQSREEDEELEEQRRRQEELADLLATGIHAFNYDDSTMNSSLTSADGVEHNYPETFAKKNPLKYEDSGKISLDNTSANLSDAVTRGYRDLDEKEQLKVLYDVRVRELNNLRDEFNKFKEEKMKEIKILKNKVTLSEADSHHFKVTLSNSESLLVEKSEIIKNLTQNITSRDEEIVELKKALKQQDVEICTYKSLVNELQLKLADNNPFNAGIRKLNSEELHKSLQDKILKLETQLQEQSKKFQILEREKHSLEEDIKKSLQQKNEMEEENNLTIMGLSKKLQDTQQQCKDLFVLGEAIKKESDHFKERLEQFEANKLDISGESSKSMDKDTMMVQIEKLKRMLLDKSVEINTFKAKLKFYNSDLSELFEYREILNKMYSCEIKPCSNTEHEELIIFMQRQLQSYQQAVEDRNNQIINLNMINKELQEKIEETIQQTRTDIQNISQKYSLPQLEVMNDELKNAEDTIISMKKQLSEKDELIQKLQNVTHKNDSFIVREKNKIDDTLAQLREELKEKNDDIERLLKDISEFKKTELQLIDENEKVKTQLQKICLKLGLSEAEIFESDGDVHNSSSLKTKYEQIHDQLQHVLIHLENSNLKRINFNIIFNLKKQIRNYYDLPNEQKFDQKQIQEKLEEWDNMLIDFFEILKHSDNSAELKNLEVKDEIEELTNAKTMLEGEKVALECQLASKTIELEESKKEVASLNENNKALAQESEHLSRTVEKLNDQIRNLKNCLELVEENKLEVEKQLESTQKQLNETKERTIELEKKVGEVNENLMRENLFKELKDVEGLLDQANGDSSGVFQNCFQAQILKAEISLRDRLQEENVQKMQKIEDQYKNVITEKTELYNKEKEKWKRQEANYRKQFATVLEECGKKMEELENMNMNLIKRINILVQEHQTFKQNAISSIEKYNKVIVDCKKAMMDANTKWATLLEYYMINAAKIEKQRHKTTKSVLKKINLNEAEINLISNLYDEKIKKARAEQMKTRK